MVLENDNSYHYEVLFHQIVETLDDLAREIQNDTKDVDYIRDRLSRMDRYMNLYCFSKGEIV